MTGAHILIVGIVTGRRSPLDGHWLKSFDPDARDGRGDVRGTKDRAQALRFDTVADALACWKRVSTVRPRRPDGKPNRPLSAYTVQIVREDSEPM